jgi:hypothetical protein
MKKKQHFIGFNPFVHAFLQRMHSRFQKQKRTLRNELRILLKV